MGTPLPLKSNQSPQDVWIVIPAFNEAKILPRVLSHLLPYYKNVIVVDDGSTDLTRDLLKDFGVVLISHQKNRGQGASLRTGIQAALDLNAEVIVTFDADGQHAVCDIERLVAPIRQGNADVVLGSRFLGKTVNMPAGRKVMLKVGLLLTRWMTKLKLTDTHNGLRAFSHRAAAQCRITFDGMEHASEILQEISDHQLRYCEVPVTITYTAETLAKSGGWMRAAKILGMVLWDKFNRKRFAIKNSLRAANDSSLDATK